MAQDLALHSDPSSGASNGNGTGKFSVEELSIRRRVWGVTLMLDLFLALQLGRPSAIVDGHVFSDRSIAPTTSSRPNNAHTSTLALNPDTDPDHPLFSHTISLSRIMSRINLYLYLGFNGPRNTNTNTTPPSQSSEMLTTLEGELDMWHQSLPIQFRISIGHQPTKEVIELNMLYHVAIILLYRPL
jgi:hypothetical protein